MVSLLSKTCSSWLIVYINLYAFCVCLCVYGQKRNFHLHSNCVLTLIWTPVLFLPIIIPILWHCSHTVLAGPCAGRCFLLFLKFESKFSKWIPLLSGLSSFCFSVISFVPSSPHQHLKGANNHQSENNLQNVDSYWFMGRWKSCLVFLGKITYYRNNI